MSNETNNAIVEQEGISKMIYSLGEKDTIIILIEMFLRKYEDLPSKDFELIQNLIYKSSNSFKTDGAILWSEIVDTITSIKGITKEDKVYIENVKLK